MRIFPLVALRPHPPNHDGLHIIPTFVDRGFSDGKLHLFG